MFKEIYFVRHGETDYNKQKRTQGQEIDVSLNSDGREQARKTGAYFKKYRLESGEFDYIYASPMSRAKESAEIIKEEIGFYGDIEYDECLKERKHGIFSGLAKTDPLIKEIEDFYGELVPVDPIERYIFHDKLTKLTNEKYNNNKENNEEMKERVKPFVEKLINSPHKKILVIAHWASLTALIKQIFNIDSVPEGVMVDNSNCWICYLTYIDSFKLLMPMNNEHLKLNL